MWRWALLIVAIVGLSAAVPLLMNAMPPEASPGSSSNPTAVVPQGPVGKLLLVDAAEFDFGSISLNTKGTHQFTVKNVGDGDLKILPASSTTSCQCTVMDFDPKHQGKKEIVLKPDEETKITVGWEGKKAGPFGQQVSVLTSDPVQPQLSIAIRGQVYPPVVTMPEDLVFNLTSGIPNDEKYEIQFAVTSFDHPDLKIDVKPTASGLIEPSIRTLTEDERSVLKFKNGYRVQLTIKPTTKLGEFSETVIVTTDHPNKSELQIPVHGRRIGPISAAPELIRFQAAPTGGHYEGKLFVRGQETTNFKVTEKPSALDVRIVPADNADTAKAKVYRLIVDVPSGTAAGVIKGDIVLETDHPGASTLKVPVVIPVTGGTGS